MLNLEDFKKIIDASLQDADTLLTKSEELVMSYTEALEAIKTTEDEKEKLKTKNDELRDECRKWINRAGITKTVEQEDKQETYEEITKKLKAKMKGQTL